ncbi:hypothetical protein BSL78_11531 [Apostichopus japonicus]|uniref:NACHT domain-containing protein n=1 Tax=Stichopus japonicus TaxID=307972 RepID=A0A2G8KU86_STIJA|nr:hypothetical protein BSL78_11531 [Apostichopus japonicus]
MRVIFGDPGYGKSTLGIQLVHDWCKRVVSSPLTDIEFVIFIRFRQLGSIKSLFEAIKLFLLPIDSELSVKDIESIIRRSKSTLVIFDGYDEIDEKANFLKSDIKSIIERTMLQSLHVIVTTRTNCFPKEVASSSLYIRLNGFDNEDRRNYIKKAIVAGDTYAADDILHRLQQNPIHGDICEVPLLFVMYAHITHERGTDLKFNSVTSFFRYMISCFHNHLRNKYSDDHNAGTLIYETDHSQLDEAAFDLLTREKNKNSWSKEDFISKLGKYFYEHYLRIGLFIEEEILSFDEKYGELSSEVINRKIVVRFFHNLVCEWYAAHYLAKQVKSLSESKLRTILGNLDLFNLQYVYRFACGINSDAADLIIKYLNTLKDGEKLAILCLLEKSGTVDNIKETVRQLCVDTIYISSEHSRLLQRSTMQLIDIAFRVQIPIKCIDLEKCVDSVDPSKRKLTLSSGLKLQSLKMVKELKITERGRELTYDEVTDIFEYSVICEGLEQLTFECCLLPENSGECLFTELEKKGVLVQWNPTAQWFQLDQDGKWKGKKNIVAQEYMLKLLELVFHNVFCHLLHPVYAQKDMQESKRQTIATEKLGIWMLLDIVWLLDAPYILYAVTEWIKSLANEVMWFNNLEVGFQCPAGSYKVGFYPRAIYSFPSEMTSK